MFGLKRTLTGWDSRAYRQEIGGAWGRSSPMNERMAFGLVTGTRIATEFGWRPVEATVEGDLVLTFDGRLKPVVAVVRGSFVACDPLRQPSLCPLFVPAGALGNATPMVIAPEQSVVLECDAADQVLGDPFVALEASTLVGVRGIERMAGGEVIEVVHLIFDEDEVVYAADGALMLCPHVSVVPIADVFALTDLSVRYRPKRGAEAAMYVACLKEEDTALNHVAAAA